MLDQPSKDVVGLVIVRKVSKLAIDIVRPVGYFFLSFLIVKCHEIVHLVLKSL